MVRILAYYRRSLLGLFSQVQKIYASPWSEDESCHLVQETLIQRVTYVECQVRRLKRAVKEAKKTLGTPSQIPLTKTQSAALKSVILTYQGKIEEYQHLLYTFRSIGDALAFIYMSRWDIKPMGAKERSGSLSGKHGFTLERRVWQGIAGPHRVAILNDLTNCLRFGDITVIAENGPPAIFEVKSSPYHNEQTERQRAGANALVNYLQSDRSERNGIRLSRVSSHAEEKDRLAEINQVVAQARTQGSAFAQVENGLYYYAETSRDPSGVSNAIRSLPVPPIVFYLNLWKRNELRHYPFTLSLRDPEALFEFLNGQLQIFVFLDPNAIIKKLGDSSLRVTFEERTEWFLRITWDESTSPLELGPVRIGQHFMSRVATEFLSLDWLLDEIVYRVQRIQANRVSENNQVH